MIPKPEWRGRWWRRWHVGGGVSLRISRWGYCTLRTLDMPAAGSSGTWGVPISRSQAAAILAALGRERSQT